MAVEIERKFLVSGDGWRRHVTSTDRLRQGYLSAGSGVTVRVRTIGEAKAYLTVKSGGSALARPEFEYAIPVADARQMLSFCRGIQIDKTRHSLDLPGGDWVVDEFEGRHAGLVIAEVELRSADDPVELPNWLGAEVTGDPQYYNSSLAMLAGGAEI